MSLRRRSSSSRSRSSRSRWRPPMSARTSPCARCSCRASSRTCVDAAKASTKMFLRSGVRRAEPHSVLDGRATELAYVVYDAKGAVAARRAGDRQRQAGRCRNRSSRTSATIPRLSADDDDLDAADRCDHRRSRRAAAASTTSSRASWPGRLADGRRRCRSRRWRRRSASWPSSRRSSPLIVLVLVAAVVATWTRRARRCGRSRGIEDTAAAIAAGDLGRRIESVDRRTEVGRLGHRAEHDARADRGGAGGARGVRAAAAPPRHRRIARAPDAADGDPRLRRAVPPRRGRASGRPRAGDARDRVGIRADGRSSSTSCSSSPDSTRGRSLPATDDGSRPGRPGRRGRRAGRRAGPAARGAARRRTPSSARDATRMRQVVDNLLANVRVHTPRGTPATVTVRADGRAGHPRSRRRRARA